MVWDVYQDISFYIFKNSLYIKHLDIKINGKNLAL